METQNSFAKNPALQVEDLEATLKCVTYDDRHLRDWKNMERKESMSNRLMNGGPCKVEITLRDGEKITCFASMVSMESSLETQPVHILGQYEALEHLPMNEIFTVTFRGMREYQGTKNEFSETISSETEQPSTCEEFVRREALLRDKPRRKPNGKNGPVLHSRQNKRTSKVSKSIKRGKRKQK